MTDTIRHDDQDGALTHGDEDLFSGVLQQLLDSVPGGLPSTGALGEASKAPSPAAEASRGVPPPHNLPALGASLREIVSQVRAHYLALAEREVRRMLEEALWNGVPAAPTTVRTATPPASDGAVTPAPDAPTAAAQDVPAAAAQPTPHVADASRVANADQMADAGHVADALKPDAGPDNGVRESAVAPAPQAAPTADAASDTAGSPQALLFEQSVLLLVKADGDMQRVVRFVDEVCQKPEFRMLRMTGNPQQEGAEIALGLREPVAVVDILQGMDQVRSVDIDAQYGPENQVAVIVHLSHGQD